MELREKILQEIYNHDPEEDSAHSLADAILGIPEIAEALKVHAGQRALAEEYRNRRAGNVWQPVIPNA